MIETPSEDITVSPTRTYIVVQHDMVCPNEARFEKVILPDSFENNSKNARYYYDSINDDRAAVVLATVAYEDFTSTVTGMLENRILIKEPKEKPKVHKFDVRGTSLFEDMVQVREMLDAWNDGQPLPSTTYAGILRGILHKLAFQERFIKNLKNELLNM